MIPGRKGLFWRGALFVSIGIAIPAFYVIFSRSP
jgi:hypothetical protein